jgi:hypothetical protein
MELLKLTTENVDEIFELENKSMNTDTTFPFTLEELNEEFKNGYQVFGYRGENGNLIAKVGFVKAEAG